MFLFSHLGGQATRQVFFLLCFYLILSGRSYWLVVLPQSVSSDLTAAAARLLTNTLPGTAVPCDCLLLIGSR